MPPTTTTLYPSSHATDLVGCTYRQLDYLIRVGILTGETLNNGSGSRRAFTPDHVARLAVAYRLASAMPRHGSPASSAWPLWANAVLNGPPPPARGFAVLDQVGTVRYPHTLTVDDVPHGALVLHYDATDVYAQLDSEV
jgi:hypothetical protein